MVKNVTSDTAALRDLYCELMEEIKRRISVISDVTSGKTPLPKIVAYETCYLQLRMICELIALACLAAHGDLLKTTGRRLNKEYNVDRIIKQLERLHPSFYPIPTRQIRNPITGQVDSTQRIDTDFLTKDDLLTLYGKCGNILHKGNLKKILSGTIDGLDFEGIRKWATRIVNLLNHHQIQLIHEDHMFWVLMRGEDGRVHGALMQAIGQEN
jgi:hypothetical protein